SLKLELATLNEYADKHFRGRTPSASLKLQKNFLAHIKENDFRGRTPSASLKQRDHAAHVDRSV
ncbi:MAG: hypothetical protein M3Y27_18640, partial [Acidobacteriota bacterium]|nr:hypothetical protein [Acidobacteriota bacterium]